jgi:hypothetical protein
MCLSQMNRCENVLGIKGCTPKINEYVKKIMMNTDGDGSFFLNVMEMPTSPKVLEHSKKK